MNNAFNEYQLPSASRKDKFSNLPIERVDELADSLATGYGNVSFFQWYCGVIYEFGPVRVEEWRLRAKEGKYPGKLFSQYVKSARLSGGKR